MRLHFVVNPVAGRGRALALADAVGKGLEAAGNQVSRHVTSGPGDGAAHVATLAPDALDRLVVVGGDGTLREVINGRPMPLPWPLGVVPMGTANIVGREVQMPLDRKAKHLIQRLSTATPWDVDLIRVRHAAGREALAVANVGAGLSGEVVRTLAALRAGPNSHGSYHRWVAPIWNAIMDFEFPQLRVTIDGRRTYAATACMVQNAHNFGGLFELSPQAALDSGHLEVMLIRTRCRRDLIRIVFGAIMHRVPRFHDVKFVRGQHVKLEAATAIPMQADGDPAGRTNAELELLPQALTLLRA